MEDDVMSLPPLLCTHSIADVLLRDTDVLLNFSSFISDSDH